MAIAQMKKFVIASHQSEVSDLLETLQEAAIIQILNAERSMVSKEWPELEVKAEKPKKLEDMVTRLDSSIKFLENHATGKGQKTLFEPRIPVNKDNYLEIINGQEGIKLLKDAENTADNIENLLKEQEDENGHLYMLLPWEGLSTPVEELRSLESVTCLTGLLPVKNLDEITESLNEYSAVIEIVGKRNGMVSCVVVCVPESVSQVQKALRNADFEGVSFEGLTGTVKELIEASKAKLELLSEKLDREKTKAAEISSEVLKLQMLYDHNHNLLDREKAGANCPSTENTVLLEGWVRKKDYKKLEIIVDSYKASSMEEMELAEDELPPVEIDNAKSIKPFETITRLYGMPNPKDVDHTVFLAPFFAVFFGLCLTDAGYGFVLAVLLAFAIKKMQGDKKALWMLLICSVLTIVAGALTGGWFADSIQTLLPQGEGSIGQKLNKWRGDMMQFDPMQQPLIFIGISLALGFIQVLFGLFIGFYNFLRLGDIASAIFEKLTWIVMLSSLLLFALAKNQMLPGWIGTISWISAVVMAVLIFLFTERNSGIAGRIGGGVFAVFSTVFYLGDMLSYVRLMALGMVTAGLGMAINILTQLVMDLPYVGFILGLLLFVVGHTVNIALSLLSAFVHSLRLQFVEFFPKFFSGGGHEFELFKNDYKHVMVTQNKNK